MVTIMYITREADYAIRIVACLAGRGERVLAKSISDETGVSLRFSLKILSKLVSAGLVKSFKGTNGGYILADKPSDITLRQAIEAVDGTYGLNRCLREDHVCENSDSGCYFRDVFAEISEIVRLKLDEVTFDMAE